MNNTKQFLFYLIVIYVFSAFVFGISWFIYSPGLHGSFLFDDFPNLEPLGALGPIQSWELFWAYVSSGFSGPTGRPISLASFVLDARDWPTDPYPFKRTNLIVHLLIGILLFATIKTLLQSIGRHAHTAAWIALLATALWLLNPFLVSTTLYAVQRMTQLAALFVLLGVWGYLQGRLYLPTRPRLGYALMTLSVGLGTVLAVYSKENGVLLPLLILVIEFALRFHWTTPAPDWRWRAIFLWVPTLVIMFYLIDRIPSDGIYANRDFTLAERLWTQPRFIFDYLWHLFIPHIQTQGLYHDGRIVSTSWTTPWTTLASVIGLAGLVILALWSRYRWPLISLAILFFLGGHVLESTTIGLELYFEHRNYLPAVFLFLPVAAGLWALRNKIKTGLVIVIAVAMIGSYAAATWQRASLWGDENQLMLVWAQANPDSPRAQTVAAQTWLRMGYPEMAFMQLEEAIQRMPDSGFLSINYVALRMGYGLVSAQELETTLRGLQTQAFNAQMLRGLEHLVDTINQLGSPPEYVQVMYTGLADLREHLQGRVRVAHRFSFYLQGQLLSAHGEAEQAYEYFTQALRHYRRTESGLNMVSVLATDGHYGQALKMLEQTVEVLAAEPDSQLKRRRSTYEMEVERIRGHLLDDIEARSSE